MSWSHWLEIWLRWSHNTVKMVGVIGECPLMCSGCCVTVTLELLFFYMCNGKRPQQKLFSEYEPQEFIFDTEKNLDAAII